MRTYVYVYNIICIACVSIDDIRIYITNVDIIVVCSCVLTYKRNTYKHMYGTCILWADYTARILSLSYFYTAQANINVTG